MTSQLDQNSVSPTYTTNNDNPNDLSELALLWMDGIFDAVGEAILITTPDKKIFNLNQSTRHLFGYETEELIGQSTAILHLDREHFNEFEKRVSTSFEGGEKASFEFELKNKEGETFFSEQQVNLLKNKLGKTIGMVFIIQGITKQGETGKRPASANSLLEATLEATADGILIVDLQGKITLCNRHFREMWEIPDSIIEKGDEKEALQFVLEQLKYPDHFLCKVEELYRAKEKESIDIVEFKDGRTLERYSKPQYDKDRIIGRVWSFRDVTAERVTESKLKAYRERFEKTIEESTHRIKHLAELTMTISSDPQEVFEHIAKMLGEIFSVTVVCLAKIREEKLCYQLLYTKGTIYSVDNCSDLAKTPCATICETKEIIIHSNVLKKYPEATFLQKYNAYSYCGIPRINSDGNVNSVLFLLHESPKVYTEDDKDLFRIITQRIGLELERQKENHLHQEAEKALKSLSRAVSQSPVSILIADSQGRIEYINPKFLELTQYSYEEVIGKGTNLLNSGKNSRELYQNLWDTVKKGNEWKGEIQNKKKSGELFWEKISISPVFNDNGEVTNYIAVKEDITEQKNAAKALRQTNMEWEFAMDFFDDAIYLIDLDDKVIRANRAFYNLTGLTPEKTIGKDINQILHPQGELIPCPVCEARTKRKDAIIVMEAEHPDNPTGRPIEVMVKIVSDDKGNPLSVLMGIHDLSRQREIEEYIRRSEERYALAMRGANDGLWDADLESEEIYYSSRCKEILGFQDDEIPNRLEEWEKRIHPEDYEQVKKQIQDHIKGLTPHFQAEYRICHKDGTYRWILARGATARDNEGKALRFAGSHTDITERKKLEEEVLKSQKLDSIGTLAGGVAHDFNNILMAISTNLYLAKTYTEEEKVQRQLSKADQAITKAKNLTQQLITFSKGGAPILKDNHSISELLKEMVDFSLHGSSVKCQYEIPEDLWPAKIDKDQISQVINNLMINAIQATPEGGIVNVKAENFEYATTGNLPLEQGKYIKIMIEDKGAGIPEKDISKIFDPFFSTKDRGKGLGLATAYSIVKQHQGYIHVDSQISQGSRFFLYLPSSNQVEKEQSVQEKNLENKKIKLLILEDEEMITDLLSLILPSMGYEAEFTEIGEKTIQRYLERKKEGDPFDVVLMDLTIPGGMGGEETIKQLKKLDPEVKAIVCSGYSGTPVMANYKDYGFCDALSKPFQMETLKEKLNKLLQR